MRSSALRVPERDRLLQLENRVQRLAVPESYHPAIAERFAPEPAAPEHDEDLRAERPDVFVPEKGAPRAGRALVLGVIAGASIPLALLGILLWQGTIGRHAGDAAASHQAAALPDIALTSPEQIEAKAGEEIAFPITVDSTDALPPRSVIAVSAMPDGASFSEGRPYGATSWSLRPDELGDLRLRLPAGQSGSSDLRVEFLTADGTQLAHSGTHLNVTVDQVPPVVASAPDAGDVTPMIPQAQTAPAAPAPLAASQPSAALEAVAANDTTGSIASHAGQAHDGAMALGSANDAAQEWVEVVSPVDVHAKALQASETVRVASKGQKLRVAGRDKNWVQVSDPATSEIGWIYNRFLKPTEPPSQ